MEYFCVLFLKLDWCLTAVRHLKCGCISIGTRKTWTRTLLDNVGTFPILALPCAKLSIGVLDPHFVSGSVCNT